MKILEFFFAALDTLGRAANRALSLDEVMDLREFSSLQLVRDRESLTAQVEAIKDGRLLVKDRASAIRSLERRIAELDVFLEEV